MTAALRPYAARKAALAGEWMTRPEVAEALGVGPRVITQRAEAGWFDERHVKRTPGNHRRWRRSYIMSLRDAASRAGAR
jgi:hypothetical protein